MRQLNQGLGITGLSRDVSWGLYIAQFTFFVGVAASAVMVVLPYYLHDYKQFARITILGEFLAIAAVIMCILFIFVDLGQPARVLNIILYPSPRSLMFWDMVSLSGYLLLNATIAFVTLSAEREQTPSARDGSSHGNPALDSLGHQHPHRHCISLQRPAGRAFWLTAILAPRFLASAFAAGPALLILLCLTLRRLTGFNAGEEAIRKLAVIMTYAILINVFFVAVEMFTVFYAHIPGDTEHFEYLYWAWRKAQSCSLDVAFGIVCDRGGGSFADACMAPFAAAPGELSGVHLVLAGEGPGADRRRIYSVALEFGYAVCADVAGMEYRRWDMGDRSLVDHRLLQDHACGSRGS